MTSHPRSLSFSAFGLVLSLVMARTEKLFEESLRMALMTEPPWAPVAPMTAMILLSDMMADSRRLYWSRVMVGKLTEAW